MGVPSFYRWLVNKYPKIVVNAVEERPNQGDSIDTRLPNPNGIEFDNLYLDMNGIIHPCFHPEEDLPSPPQSFEDVFKNMFDYIDRLFGIVRPRKLLFLAIDGVAPRAKMNQQRSRRFCTARDCELAEIEEDRLRREFQEEGKHVFPKQESQISDSNVITPGTEFMHQLSKALQSYVGLRLNNDIGWKDIKVILSDSNVPGEGEHKIMSFIRMQRTFQDYDPSTRHCIFGLDADLIMLALATHEIRFSILREDILTPEQPFYQSEQNPKIGEIESRLLKTTKVLKCVKIKPYQFLHIWILREYLELDMEIFDPPENMKNDIERIIDDFIFICFFLGNDFLPHMPSLQIHEGAMDLLMHVYKQEFKKFGGYLVDVQYVNDEKMRYINLKRIERFILSVGQKEELIFKKRTELRERKLKRLLSECSIAEEEDGSEVPSNSTFVVEKLSVFKPFATTTPSIRASTSTESIFEVVENTKELKDRLKSWSRDRGDLFKDRSFFVDKIRLGDQGFKQRYYNVKFSAEGKEDIEHTRKTLVQMYTEGLCWVLLYYFSGVPSWTWFYDSHYGPFASDMRGMSNVRVKFEKGSPFKPLDQLMGVLPPRSAHALPKVYRELMTSPDSNIQDFYPSDFEVDTDGKRFLWQGICLLPFIDEKRLTSETKKLELELKEDEVTRNSKRSDLLFFKRSDLLEPHIFSVCREQLDNEFSEIIKKILPTYLSCGINASISPLDAVFTGLRPNKGDFMIKTKGSEDDAVLCIQYNIPSNVHRVPPRPLTDNFPEKTIYEEDIVKTKLWHEHPGTRTSYRSLTQNYSRGTISDSKLSPNMPIHKFAGSGWSSGRGKGFNPGPERDEIRSSYSGSAIEYGQNRAYFSSTNEYWRCGGRGRGRGYPIPSLNTSGNRQYYRSPADREEYSGYSKSIRGGQSNDSSWKQNTEMYDRQKYDEQPRIGSASKNTNGVRGRGRGQGMLHANAGSPDWRVRGNSGPSANNR